MNRTRTLQELLQARDQLDIDRFTDIPRLIDHCRRLELAIAEARRRECNEMVPKSQS